MGKITTVEPAVKSLHGKVAKSDKIYFKNLYGATRIVRVDHPYQGPLTAAQKAINERFRIVNAQVSELKVTDPDRFQELKRKFSAQRKYKTLRGYIFRNLWDDELESEMGG